MRTTVNIDEHVLAEAKLLAAREHRTIGSVLEEGLRVLIESRTAQPPGQSFDLHTFRPEVTGLQVGVDLEDKDLMGSLLDDDGAPRASA